MSIVAIVPVAQLLAANDALELQGFGPRNFSVPAYSAPGATFAALHAWADPAFAAALAGIPGVIVETDADDPITATRELIEAQGAQWGAQAPTLPSDGPIATGSLWQLDGVMWWVITGFNRTTFPLPPATYPALIRRVRNPNIAEAWQQPIDQFDAYRLLNAFTDAPDEALHLGQRWRVSQVDGGGNNVWEPGVFGWVVVP